MGEESSGSPFPLGPAIQEAYPSLVENYTRIFNFQREKHLIQVDSTLHEVERIYFADTSFFSLFDYTFVSGTAEGAFSEKNSIILTESKAFDYFGNEPAVGKTIKYQEKLILKVTGIIYLMNLLMKGIAYRASTGPGGFVLPSLAGLFIMAITIVVQSYKTSKSNPAEILKDK